jgi:hypothetical protein
MAKVRGAEGPRANVVITKGTVKTDAESFALNVVLVDIVYLLYNSKECVVKRGKKLYGLLEEVVRIVASIVAQIVDVDSETRLTEAKHAENVIFVVVDRGYR